VQRYNLFSILPKLFLKIFFSLFLNLAPFLKAGAKVQPFFELTKCFLKNFLIYFDELAPFLKAGAKLLQLFELTK